MGSIGPEIKNSEAGLIMAILIKKTWVYIQWIARASLLEILLFSFFNQMPFENSDRAAYSDLKPLDGGQSLYPMSTV